MIVNDKDKIDGSWKNFRAEWPIRRLPYLSCRENIFFFARELRKAVLTIQMDPQAANVDYSG